MAALARLGAAVLSTDAVVHECYDELPIREAVVARFGAAVLDSGDSSRVSRPALARAAFASDEGREWLEHLLWPRVDRRIHDWRQQAVRAQPPPRAAVVEIPLLFEAGAEHGFDATIAVVADEAVRFRRAAARGHEALRERAARQFSQDEKARRADHVVVNDGTVAELQRALSSVLDMLEG